jgi:hypothetical protein
LEYSSFTSQVRNSIEHTPLFAVGGLLTVDEVRVSRRYILQDPGLALQLLLALCAAWMGVGTQRCPPRYREEGIGPVGAEVFASA